MRRYLLSFVLLSAPLFLPAQQLPVPVPPAAPTKSAASATDYSGEAVVVESDDVIYQYAMDGSGSKTEHMVVRVQSNAALQSLAVLRFPYASGNQRLDILQARVRKPDGTVVETPASDVQDQPAPATQVAPMYSDLHIKQLPVRSLAVGDRLEYEIRTTIQKSEVPGEFWGQEGFGTGVVFLERSIELSVPRKKQVTVYSPDHAPEVTEAGDKRVYRWKGSQLKMSNAKNDEDAEPKDKKPPIAWTTFPSWEAVGLWYRGLIAGRDAVTPALQAKADELTANAKTDTDKVRALYAYVSTHNHYIGVDFGVGHYQPHMAAEVMANQYGDCKDKHTLLAALLRAKGFSVSAVLIGMGIEMNEKVPMPGMFNHLITLVDVDGQKVWLDATTEVAPYRVLLSVLRDKEALVVPATGTPQLMKTPADLPFAPMKSFVATSDMDQTGSFKGHVDVSIRGDEEIFVRLATRQVARGQWDQFSQAYSSALFYNVTTSATVIDPPEDTSGPWHMRYEFVQSPYSEWKHFQIASLLPAVSLPTIDEKKPPKKEIELGELRTETAQSTIHLPAGYGADLPDAIHLKTAFATYDKTYQVKEGSLIGEYRLETLKKKVPAAEWKDVKKFVDDIGEEPWIQLTRTDHIMGEAGPPAAGENNSAAAKLVQEMVEALSAKDIPRATKLADEAAALNDKQRGLWSARAYMALLRGDYSESAADYERELLQHPEETDLYQGLLYAEVRADRKKEELEWLHKYRKVAPANEKVTIYVAARLAGLGETAEAIAMYRDGLKALPESKLLRRNFATTLLANGKSDEGVAMMKAALEGSDDPMVLNDGAYTLANHGFELDYSENMSRKSVDLLEAETRQVSLDGANKNSMQRMDLLLGSWDTLGWIYFLEGKTELAVPYLRAAWENSYHPEEGLHLGQALEKQGDRKQAMETYELALSRLHGSSGKLATDLTARIEGLEKQGLHRKSPHADSVFQDKRTFRVPRPAALKGSAVVLFQVSATKTEHVKLVSGSDALKEREKALAALDLKLEVPKDSHALLVRSGVFFCSTQPTCELVLTPPESADVK